MSTKKPPISGPITLVTPNTAPKMPWYLPRSRGETTSPMIVWAPMMRPPPPMPCSARNAINMIIEPLSPASAEPIRKMMIAAWKKILRPYWSPSLPHSGVDAVEARMYAVTTQEMCDRPCRSPAMVGSAVATMVWSSAASSRPSSSAPMITSSRR